MTMQCKAAKQLVRGESFGSIEYFATRNEDRQVGTRSVSLAWARGKVMLQKPFIQYVGKSAKGAGLNGQHAGFKNFQLRQRGKYAGKCCPRRHLLRMGPLRKCATTPSLTTINVISRLPRIVAWPPAFLNLAANWTNGPINVSKSGPVDENAALPVSLFPVKGGARNIQEVMDRS